MWGELCTWGLPVWIDSWVYGPLSRVLFMSHNGPVCSGICYLIAQLRKCLMEANAIA